jgi:hypothetical protein
MQNPSWRSAPAAAWLLALVAAGCTSTSSPAPASCADLQQSARAVVEQAITSNLACKTDSDCVVVTLAASCFDACARAVAATGTAAVQAAIDDVEADQCKAANADGCTVAIPPCVATTRPTCPSGFCQ